MKLIAKTLIAGISFIAASAFAANYQIDPAHSSINFTAGHLGFSKTVGRFDQFSGTFSDTAGAASVSVEIDPASINTNHNDRDDHLRSPDFFDVKQYPRMTFTSTSFTGDTLTGNLTMHGVTRPVTLNVTEIGEGEDPWGGYRKGFEAVGKLNRSAWGITYFIPGVPDEIELEIHVEGIRQ